MKQPHFKKRAIVLSVFGHVLLSILLFQLGHTQTITRTPRSISATLVQRGPGGLPKQMGSNSATPGSAAPAPAKKAPAEPQKTPVKEPPKEKAATPLPAKKKEPEKKQTKPTQTPSVQTPSRNPFAKGEGGAGVETAPNKSGGGSGGTSPYGSKSGAGGGGIRLDAPEFPFPHYLALLQFRIESQWRPPYAGVGEYLATVHFVVDKSGRVLSSKLEKSSGVFAFDQAALRAVQGANPLPALPEGSDLETLGVHFDFVANW